MSTCQPMGCCTNTDNMKLAHVTTVLHEIWSRRGRFKIQVQHKSLLRQTFTKVTTANCFFGLRGLRNLRCVRKFLTRNRHKL